METEARSHETPGNTPRTITDPGEFMDSFLGSTRNLIQAERDHITFLVTLRTAEAVRKVAGSLAAFVFYGIAVLIASLGFAIWLGRELDNVVLGFTLVAAGYVVIGVVFGLLWKGLLGNGFITGLINRIHGH